MTLVPDDADRLLDFAELVAVEAATFVHQRRREGAVSAETKSTETDMITEYDRASERLIVERIRQSGAHWPGRTR